MAGETENKIIQEDEIDLVELAKTIWAGRKLIAKTTGVFVLIGLVIAFTSPVEYEASCKLLPESQKAKMLNLGGLAGIAGIAGVDLSSMAGGTSEILTPQLYPEIVNSLPFILEVMNDTVYFEQKKLKVTSFRYFKEVARPSLIGSIIKYSVGLPGLIKRTIIGDANLSKNTSSFFRVSKEDWGLIEKFKKRITVEIDDETGIIEVIAEMPDPFAAAQITKKIELMLTEAVIEYKIDKVRKNLEFTQETYNESQKEFENIQLRLARISDRNQNVTSATAEIELKKIEHEFDIAFSVYKSLSTEVEKAKIQLKKETPVFTVLEPVRIPVEKIKPMRAIILIIFMAIGLFCSSTYLTIKMFLEN